MTDLAQHRSDIAAELALLNERDLRAVGRIVKVFIAMAGGERSPFERFDLELDDRADTEDDPDGIDQAIAASSLGTAEAVAIRAQTPAAVAVACVTRSEVIAAELEAGLRCRTCLDAIVAGECGCPDVFGEIDAEVGA